MDGNTFRVFVTNRQGDGAELWRDYNQRAYCEQHIEKLKNGLYIHFYAFGCMALISKGADGSGVIALCETFAGFITNAAMV